jgi:hypothetical protein
VADGFSVATPGPESFNVAYVGDYPGLTAYEIATLVASGPWYPQKTDGNAWQAEFSVVSGTGINVHYVDWGDVLESVSPTSGRPTRIEVTLYADADNPLSDPIETMTGYTMAVLEYPSSSNELQGTNAGTYESLYATVVSGLPKLVIQYFGSSIPEGLNWSINGYWYLGETDVQPSNIIPISFAPELNVGGKYIYGASEGGWRPTQTGKYRLTYYIPAGSNISLAYANVRNYSPTGPVIPTEGGASTPVVDPGKNLTYDDVTVVTKGGGGGGGRR